MSEPALRLAEVSAGYGGPPVLHDVDLTVPPGGSVAVLGPSGCGKSTLLRAVAGLTPPSSGTIEIAGRKVDGPSVHVPPESRGAALVFQDLALWPHLTVAGNLSLVLEARGVAAASRPGFALTLAADVGLPAPLLERRPGELSGGERQRAALARALAQDPRVLLLDEPLTGLDRHLRRHLLSTLTKLREEKQIATLLVTHDHTEAFALAERVVVLSGGRVAQEGTPAEVHDRPASRFVAEFVGTASVLAAERTGGRVSTALGTFDADGAPGGPLVAVFRPGGLRLAAEGTAGRVTGCTYRGGDWMAEVKLGVDGPEVLVTTREVVAAGTPVCVVADPPGLVPSANSGGVA